MEDKRYKKLAIRLNEENRKLRANSKDEMTLVFRLSGVELWLYKGYTKTDLKEALGKMKKLLPYMVTVTKELTLKEKQKLFD